MKSKTADRLSKSKNRSPPQNQITKIKQEEELVKLHKLTEKTSQILIRLKGFFPLDLFPDEIVVDANKINIVYRYFIESEDTKSILIEDVEDVIIQTIPFFATLIIIDRRDPEKPTKIGFLKKKEAYRAKRIIEGLIIAKKKHIDVGKIVSKETTEQLEKLGEVKEAEK